MIAGCGYVSAAVGLCGESRLAARHVTPAELTRIHEVTNAGRLSPTNPESALNHVWRCPHPRLVGQGPQFWFSPNGTRDGILGGWFECVDCSAMLSNVSDPGRRRLVYGGA